MKKNIFRRGLDSVILLFLLFVVSSCTTVALTGRSRINLIPDYSINSLAASQYTEFMRENKLSSDAAKTQTVKTVGSKIVAAVNQYCSGNYIENDLANYDWQFNLIEDDQANAWALPGGKVVVYTGILKYADTPDALAVVISHEIAHVFAKHGSERMSQLLLVELGSLALSEAMKNEPAKTQEIFVKSYSAGTQLGVVLPYSRVHEMEADRLGLIFMAIAGYDPKAAVTFWEKMAQKDMSKKPPEFLSTHPSDARRIEYIKGYIPEAMQYYRK